MSGPGNGGVGGLFGIPDPLPILLPGLLDPTSALGGGGVLGGLFDGLGGLIERGIASAARSAFDQLESLVNNSAGSISFGAKSWWAAKVDTGAGGLWPTMLSISVAVLLGCLILAVIQGALSGDPMVAVRAVAVEVPKSVFGMATVVALTSALVSVVDGA